MATRFIEFKRIRRLLALMVALVCLASAVSVYAESTNSLYEVAVTGQCIKANSVKITANLVKNSGIAAADMALSYPNGFTLKAATLTDIIAKEGDSVLSSEATTKNPYNFTWMDKSTNTRMFTGASFGYKGQIRRKVITCLTYYL